MVSVFHCFTNVLNHVTRWTNVAKYPVQGRGKRWNVAEQIDTASLGVLTCIVTSLVSKGCVYEFDSQLLHTDTKICRFFSATAELPNDITR